MTVALLSSAPLSQTARHALGLFLLEGNMSFVVQLGVAILAHLEVRAIPTHLEVCPDGATGATGAPRVTADVSVERCIRWAKGPGDRRCIR